MFRGWLYGCPFDKYLFNVHAIENLKNDAKIVEKARALIKKYFCNASVRLEMIPDTKLVQEKENAQTQQMAELLEKMMEQEKEDVVKLQTTVANRQKQENDPKEVEKIGTISNDELRHVGDNILGLQGNYKVEDNIGYFTTVTNSPEIVYVHVIFDITKDLTFEQIRYFSLLARCITRVGTKDFPCVEQLQE